MDVENNEGALLKMEDERDDEGGNMCAKGFFLGDICLGCSSVDWDVVGVDLKLVVSKDTMIIF